MALADGFRESTESRADLLRSCRRRGMTAPVLAVGDGAGVLEGRAGGVPRRPRAAVLVPRQLQCSCRPAEVGAPWGEIALAEIYNAEDRDHALAAVNAFEADYGAKGTRRS